MLQEVSKKKEKGWEGPQHSCLLKPQIVLLAWAPLVPYGEWFGEVAGPAGTEEWKCLSSMPTLPVEWLESVSLWPHICLLMWYSGTLPGRSLETDLDAL